MIDISGTTESTSNQLDAIDLVAGPKIITITSVKIVQNPQQPVEIGFDGCGTKPFRPCKTVRRVLCAAWGRNGEDYVGRSLELYNDPEVIYGGKSVGGVRISKMSHIEKSLRLMLTVTRGKKKPYTVEPLQLTPANPMPVEHVESWKGEIDQCGDMATLSEVAARIKEQNYADSPEKAAVLQHYQVKVADIRNKEAGDIDPANMEFPADPEATESSEGGSLPGL
jgi:hypothetical protein